MSAFVVNFRKPKDPSIAGKKTPSIVGIRRDQSKSIGHKLGIPRNPIGRGRNRKLRDCHGQFDWAVASAGIVLNWKPGSPLADHLVTGGSGANDDTFHE